MHIKNYTDLLRLILLGVFLQISVNSYANQPRIDSLRVIFESEHHDKTASEILKIAAKQSFIDYDAAMALSDIALQKTRKEKNLPKQFYAHRERGFISEENNHLERALQEFEFAKSVANAMDDNRDRLTIYTDLAIVNKKLGNYKAATDYHSMTLFLAKEEGDLEMVEDNLHGLGSIYERVGDYEQALDYFLESLQIAEKRESIPGRIMTIQAIAKLYLKTKNNSQALENIEKAYRLAESANDSLIIANVLNDYGNILASLGDYDLALIKLSNSLRICESGNRKVAQARTMIEIADVYTKKGDLEKAKEFFMKCFEIEKYIPPKELASLYSALGNLEMRQEDFERAKGYFDRSIVLLSTIKNSFLEQQNNYSLYEIYKEEGNASKALGYLEGYNKLQEEILNKEQQQRIAEKRFQFEMDKTKSKLQKLAATQNKTMLIGTSTTLLVIITFLFFNNSLRKKNNSTLKIKAAEIEDQNKKLTESNEVLKQFAYAAAHDLKEPLRNIGSFISLIKKRYGPELNEEANGYMNYVVKAVKRMNDLLLDLLEFSAISTEKASSDIINIGNILDEVVYALQENIQEREARIEYTNDFPPIKMNRMHMMQLFQSLISNSLKFNLNIPVITIDAKINTSSQTILIEVADNGIGMEKEFEDKVFLMFHQLDKNSGYTGTGMGLTICKNIVEKYNGEIWFESKLGFGTKFYINLPLDPTKHIAKRALSEPTQELTPA